MHACDDSREDVAVLHKQTALTAKGGPRSMMVSVPLPGGGWETPVPSAAAAAAAVAENVSAPSSLGGSGEGGGTTLSEALEAARKRELQPRLERQVQGGCGTGRPLHL